jgi:hypothetical protein
MPHFFGLSLRDLPVLAIETPEIAPGGGDGEDGCGGVKMVERFLFYGVHVYRTGIPVGQGVELSPDIYPGTADTSVPWFKVTPIGTDLTLNIRSV